MSKGARSFVQVTFRRMIFWLLTLFLFNVPSVIIKTAIVQWGSCAKNPVSTLLEKTNVFDCTVFGFKWNRPKVTAQLKQDNWPPLWPWENDNSVWTSFYTTRGLPTTIPSFFTETIALSKMILISSFSKLSMQKPPCAKTSV